MQYQISQKNDLNLGAQLVVSFPEEDLDKKALRTLQTDFPEFLVPFHQISIDGSIECIYELGNRTKLRYLFGLKELQEYITFWEHILQPLIACRDWFLTPSSFVTDADLLYVDKDGTVSYLYIPSRQPWGDKDALLQMVTELSRCNPATDPALENQVLRSIMEGFQPKQFLANLRSFHQPIAAAEPAPVSVPVPGVPPQNPLPSNPPHPEPAPQAAPAPLPAESDDIVIHLSDPQKKRESGKATKGWNLFKSKKDAEPKKKKAERRGKEKKEPELRLGAGMEQVPQPVTPAPVWQPPAGLDYEATQLSEESGVPHFRLIGDPSLPREIPVAVPEGRAFTIGRFDVTVGRKQSDFEFDKRTRAVSRRHAAVECSAAGCTIVDLASSAGTFVNGERLTPNIPRRLNNGDRVSFGTGGADYIWEA